MMRVFQIGFNRCGTLSLCKFFNQNGHKAVHWDNGRWGEHFNSTQSRGVPLCEGYDNVVLWTDIGFIQRQFQVLAEQYPESRFIYNIRPLDKWLDSRTNWYSIREAHNFVPIQYRHSDIDRRSYWKAEWIYHKRVLKEYFVGGKLERLLIFDIEKNTGEDIEKFLPELEFTNLNFPHEHKSD